MKKRLFSIVISIIILFTSINSIECINANASDFVQITSYYTYEEMIDDIANICQTYPQYVSSEIIGYSVCGRAIPMVILGNPSAPHKVLIQSNIHASEYQCAPVAMKMIEYYATNYSTGNLLGVYSKTCYYIVPMVNPDGVAISQFGASSVSNEMLQFFVTTQGDARMRKWKANADGVDLNRNWNAGWELTPYNSTALPSYASYKGIAPETEPEIKALKNITVSQNFDCYINFHQQGNVIYCGSNMANPYVNALSQQLASVVKSVNGYKIIGPSSGTATSFATYADYICGILGKPSCTLEFGNRIPTVKSADSTAIFNRNINLLKAVSDYL